MKFFDAKVKKVLTMLFIVVGWFLIGWFIRGYLDSRQSMSVESTLLEQVLANVENKAFSQIPSRRELTYSAVRAIMADLGDKYAEFRDAALAARNANELSGQGSAMIGIQGEMKNGDFVITSLIPDGPADKAGVKIGDKIKEIDGWKVAPSTTAGEVLLMAKNPKKPVADVTILRNQETLSFHITREEIPEVISEMDPSNVAYIRFDHVGSGTPKAVQDAVEALMAKNPKGLMIDLRYNGGGWMDATQKILDLFLDDGVAFYAKMKDGRLITYSTKNGDITKKIPIVVLVSHNTYSASETIAASLQDRKRGVVIGETTHGKGSIKETVKLVDGSEIDFTVARWLTPVSKMDDEGKGVTPDIMISDDNTEDNKDAIRDYAVEYFSHNP